ncbi:hypothetical protein ACHAWO_004682 [Cyclotella atomus]|uniref:Ribonuclease n=1 Tax=Cyclotella atomus TaxID=382360 RepID=A0ABD3QI19_9STRA
MWPALLTTLYFSRHHSIATTIRAPRAFNRQLHRLRPSLFLHQRPISSTIRRDSRLFGIHHTLTSVMTTTDTAPRRSARLAKLDTAPDNTCNSLQDDKYSSMKVAELKELLKQNGLGLSGNKAELIHRLSSNAVIQSATAAAAAGNDSKKRTVSRKVTPDTAADEADDDGSKKQKVAVVSTDVQCLPRTREMQLKTSDMNLTVLGVDEAGRGPLAGPVVAAAAIVPINISGVIDSKKITKEEEREQLYEAIVASPGVRYAVAVVSAQRIDEINILQATLEGMRIATEAVMKLDQEGGDIVGEVNNHASADRTEISYVITGSTQANGEVGNQSKTNNYYALIDGNKVPKEMPCPAESMIQGDGREFAIAAASILAKVTRDRLMHEYDKKYPEYELSRHKGYPTAAHMAIVKKIGASPIHRRTFAPLKYMKFDADGKIID